jgi:hypothetical protein
MRMLVHSTKVAVDVTSAAHVESLRLRMPLGDVTDFLSAFANVLMGARYPAIAQNGGRTTF